MTIDLDTTMTKIVLGLIVVGAGAVGGVAAELLKTRKISATDEEGGWEMPKRVATRYYDLGGWASVLLGIVAAAVAMGLFDLVKEVQRAVPAAPTDQSPTTITIEQYDLWRVVAVALVAGFSAPKFLATAQERLIALVSQQQMETTVRQTAVVTQAGFEASRNAPDEAKPALAAQQAEVINALATSALPGGSVPE